MSAPGMVRLAPRLYLGSVPTCGPQALRGLGFDAVVLCAQELLAPGAPQDAWATAAEAAGLAVCRCPLDDARLSAEEIERATRAAAWAAARLGRGQRVLVTCYQGRNRSGLVAAMALRLVTRCTGRAAVARVRAARRQALTNPSFAAYLQALPAPPAWGAAARRSPAAASNATRAQTALRFLLSHPQVQPRAKAAP